MSIICLVCIAIACLGGSFAYANTSTAQESSGVERSQDYVHIAEDPSINLKEEQLTPHTNKNPSVSSLIKISRFSFNN
jgi:hypothetical protein